MFRRASLVVAVALAASWPIAARAEVTVPAQPASQVVLSGDVSVARGTVVREVVVFSGSATVAGVVQNDVVVLDGPVTIGGQVGGDVIALHGPIRLLPTAQVSGDVLAGGHVDIAQGAEVSGAIKRDVTFTLSGPVGGLGALVVSLAMSVSILLGGLVLLLLAPQGVERAAEAARSAPFAAAGWGILAAIGLPLASIVLAVTILGMPLGLVLLLGLGLLWMFGLVMATFAIGRAVVREPRSRLGALFAGWAIVGAVGLVPFLNVVWWTLGGVFGVGIALVATWRARSGEPPVPRDRGGRHRAPRRAVEAPNPPVPVGAERAEDTVEVPPAED